MLRCLIVTVLFLIALCADCAGYEQKGVGSIHGQVTDAKGEALSGARIAFAESLTHESFVTSTDARGLFSLKQLSGGSTP